MKGPTENAIERLKLYGVTNQGTPRGLEVGGSKEGFPCLAPGNSDRAPTSSWTSGIDPPKLCNHIYLWV